MSDAPTTLADGGLDRVFDAIEAILPGVLHPVVQMCVFDALDDFCTRSTIWRRHVLWELPPGETTIAFNPLDDTTGVRWILDVCGLGRRYRIAQPATLVATCTDHETRDGSALVVCKPRKLSAPFPAWLVDDWSEAIRDGALYRLFTQPSKPYSNAALAQMHGQRYRVALIQAKVAANHADAPYWRFPYFAAQRFGRLPCRGGSVDGTGGIIVPPVLNLPVLAISPGVITDGALPALSISPGVITGTDDAAPGVTLSTSSLTFASTAQGANASQTITLTNSGATALTITAAAATGDFSVTGVT